MRTSIEENREVSAMKKSIERGLGSGSKAIYNGRHVIEIENVSKSFFVYTNGGETVITEKKRFFSRKKPVSSWCSRM